MKEQLKPKNQVSKQTNIKQLAESFKPITKNLEEASKKTDPENETPTQLAIKKTKPDLQNTQNQTPDGVECETSSEHTLETMKISKKFFERQNIPQGDFSWKGKPVRRLAGTKLQLVQDQYSTSNP